MIPYIHIPAIAKEVLQHMHEEEGSGSSLISYMGLFAAAGKIVFGMICSWTDLTPLNVFIPAQALFGLVTVLAPFCSQYWHLMTFSVSFG